MRLFVAGFPPAEAVEHLRRQTDRLHLWRSAGSGGRVRPATPESWHLTLAFLGPVADRRGEAQEALGRGVDRWRGEASGPPTLRLAGGGRFGSGRSTVLWVGVSGDVAELVRLSDTIREELRRSAVPYEERPLRPHLTLGRPGDRLSPTAVQADVATLDDYAGPEWTLDVVELVASDPGRAAGYERLWAQPV